MKIHKKTQLLKSHLAFLYAKMCKLIRLIICESLVEIQQFRHEWYSIMYENTQETQ